jgi:hypothetical protein
MRLRVSDPAAAADLGEFLRERAGTVVEVTGTRRSAWPAELEVSMLGSYGEEALRDEIEAAVRRWAFARGRTNAVVELE